MTLFIEIPWSMREILISCLKNQENAVFLESHFPSNISKKNDNQSESSPQQRAKWGFLCPQPQEILTIDINTHHNPEDFWQKIRSFYKSQRPKIEPTPPPQALQSCPFLGGIIGMISYEAGLICEDIISRHPKEVPLAILMACLDLYIIDEHEKKIFWVSDHHNPPPILSHLPSPSFPFLTPTSWHAEQTQKAWEEKVENVREFIKNGDIFQANLTMRWTLTPPPTLTALEIYQALRLTSPAPFSAYFTIKNFSLLSASVERFLSVSQYHIETRPIKGTQPLSASPENLAQDSKERAENIMITDLMRHDIGRVCEIGSVAVPKLCEVERFNHLYHLVSHITGKLRESCDICDLLHATLPPGSVTGAPKYRALEIIDLLEDSPRGAYCGILFRLSWEDNFDSAVIIRSLTMTPQKISLGAGGGITYPSNPTKEYEEMLLKASPLLSLFHCLN